MSFSQAIEGYRKTLGTFIDYDVQRFMEFFDESDGAKAATAGLMALIQTGEQYVHILAEHFSRAETVYWSPEMSDMLMQVAPSLPDWTLRLNELLPEYGFAWFAKPIPLPGSGPLGLDAGHPLVGMVWGTVLYSTDPSLGKDTKVGYLEGDAPGVDRWVIYSPVVLFDGAPRLCGGSSWAEGESLSELLRLSEVSKEQRGMEWAVQIGKIFAASMALMQQEITVNERTPVDRSTRRRLEREGWIREAIVNVVKLRRAKRQGGGDGKSYELTCQFVVRGHWRNQYYPSTNEHRPIFVLPYIKGPEGAPLKAQADRVFEVVR